MPVDVAKLIDSYNAQSALNTDALAAWTARYPLVIPGATFTDANGLDWKVITTVARNNNVTTLCRYVDAIDGDTEYVKDYYAINAQRLMFPYSDSFAITGTPGTLVYTRTDLQYGEITQITVDGGAPLVEGVDYTFNSDTALLTLTGPYSAGQIVDIDYKKAPYYYGYP